MILKVFSNLYDSVIPLPVMKTCFSVAWCITRGFSVAFTEQ